MEEVIEVVEGDVEGSLGDGHHGYVEGSVIVLTLSGVYSMVMPMGPELVQLEL